MEKVSPIKNLLRASAALGIVDSTTKSFRDDPSFDIGVSGKIKDWDLEFSGILGVVELPKIKIQSNGQIPSAQLTVGMLIFFFTFDFNYSLFH